MARPRGNAYHSERPAPPERPEPCCVEVTVDDGVLVERYALARKSPQEALQYVADYARFMVRSEVWPAGTYRLRTSGAGKPCKAEVELRRPETVV